MKVQCNICKLEYEDTYHWTFCPHAWFQMQTLVSFADGSSQVVASVEEMRAAMERKKLEEIQLTDLPEFHIEELRREHSSSQ